MKIQRNAILSVLFFALTATIQAQTSFTVEQAVAAALKSNLVVEQNLTDLMALKRKDSRSLNGLSPSLSLGGNFSLSTTENPNNDFGFSGTAKISFTLTSQTFTDVKQARINYEGGLITYESAVRSIELAVRKSFYGLLYQQVNIELQRNNLETSRSRYEQTLEKYNRGVIPELDVLAAQVNYESLKPQLASAETSYQNNLANFKQLIGINQKTDIVLSGSLSQMLSLQAIILPEEISSLTVQALEKQLQSARFGVTSVAAGAYSPSLSLGYTYNPMYTSQMEKWTHPSASNGFTAAVSLPLDGLLPWSKSKESIDTARDMVTKIALQLEDAKTTSMVNTETYMRKISQSMLSIETNIQNVELAKKSYQMMLDAYNRGTRDLLSVENAANALFQAEVQLMSEQYNLVTAVMDLENEINVPFGTLGK